MAINKGNIWSTHNNSCSSNEGNKIPDHELSNKIAISGLIRVTRITLITLTTQKQLETT